MPRYIYGVIAAAAVAVIASISYSTYLANRSANFFSPLLVASHEIRTASVLAHLWTEEALVNDPDVRPEDIMNYYDKAYGYAAAMLEGGRVHEKPVFAVDDEELRSNLELTKEKIAYCREMSEKRLALGNTALAGTDIDQAFDRAFEDLLETAQKAEDKLQLVIDRDMKTFHSIQSALILSSFLLSIIAGIMVFRFSRKRTRDLLTIEEKNRELLDMNQQLLATEQQLKASNQQLLASEQQLKASNQQLLASEQQLKASNQQLLASEQQLKASNQQLLAGEQQLKASNQQLLASEQALRESESRYRTLFTDMAEGVALHRVIYDEKGTPVNYEIINVNPRYEAILQVPREQVVGKLATEAYGVPEAPYISEYAHVAETGIPYRFETYFPPMEKFFDISVSSFEKGYFATIFSDITERKQAEETIRLNEARLEILWEASQYKAETINDLLDFALDKAIRITGSKIGFVFQYDEKKKELVLGTWSKDVLDKCSIQNKDTFVLLNNMGICREAARQGKPFIINDFQSPHLQKRGYPEGHMHISRFLSIPVFSDSRITAVVGVANKSDDYDRSDVKQLSLFMDAIWKLVEKHRAEDERLKLRTQMQKLESLGVLAGGIAHDFNNLLTAMLANINLVAIRFKDDERTYKGLSEAEKACLRAQALTKQLLTFASGGAPVKSVFHPDEIIRDFAEFALRGTRASCEFNFTDDLWPIEVDEGQMGQVISNLAINAVQAMPEGGAITFGAGNIDIGNEDGLPLKSGPYVKITVEDRGVGIPEDYLTKIFDPYFTTKQHGSGLGLAVTYSIIKKHDGHITVDSTPGKGSVFHVYIPASPGEIPEEKPAGGEIAPGKGHILLMEDEEMVAAAAGAILNEYGYDVTFAGDGKEAIGLYTKMKDLGKPFDLVIMDLTIRGGMGGKDAVRELLKIDPDAKVIVSSGYSNDPVLADFRSYGFKGIISKPYKVEDILDTIYKVMNDMS